MADPTYAVRRLEHGRDYPYDAPDTWRRQNLDQPPPPAKDWAHAAARGVIADLCDRRDIKRGFEGVDGATRKEIVRTLAAIIRLAQKEGFQ